MEIALIFITGFLAAFIGSLPPGLINMNTARIALLNSKKHSENFNIGAAIASALYATLAVIILNHIQIEPTLFSTLYGIGATVLFILSIFFLTKYYRTKKGLLPHKVKYRNSFLYGVELSLLNIIQLPYYLTICIIYLNRQTEHYLYNYSFIISVFLGIWTILEVYKYVFLKHSQSIIIEKYFFKYAYIILFALCIILTIITLRKI